MTVENAYVGEALRETAASHAVTHIPRATADTPAKVVIQALQGQKFECADTVFVVDAEQRLQGIVRVNDLFASSERRIGEIMEPEHEAVRLGDNQEQIAVLAMRLNMIAVPVVDDTGKLVGAVPPEALSYVAWVDPGGLVPNWAQNWASKRALPRLAQAVRQAAQERSGSQQAER